MTPQKIEEILTDPDTIIGLAQALKKEQEKARSLSAKVESDRPKVLFADSVSASSTSILVGELAKLLRQNGVDVGQNRLFELLRERGYLMKDGSSRNMPTQRSMDLGLFEMKETVINRSDGGIDVKRTPKVTGRGQVYFLNKFLGGHPASAAGEGGGEIEEKIEEGRSH
jgi:anti-repressor protein